MTDEMKLLMALCDALGFKVETLLDYKEMKVSKSEAMPYNMGYTNQIWTLDSNSGELAIDEDGMYTRMLTNPEVSYKLTERKPILFDER